MHNTPTTEREGSGREEAKEEGKEGESLEKSSLG